jgi:hypothetical protein
MGLAGRSWNSTSHVVHAAGSVLLRLMGNTLVDLVMVRNVRELYGVDL